MKTIFAVFASLFFLNSLMAQSPGDLLITPYRVVFEGNKILEELTVANTGTDTATYSIGFLQYKMTTEGALELINEPEEGVLFANKYLRFFPRTIVLAPNEAQVVRLQVRTPPNLEPGEYRSHLYFRSVVDVEPDMAENADTSLGIQLIPVYGISIPVIVRVGNLEVETNIGDYALKTDDKGQPVFEFNLLRSGGISAFGALEITHIDTDGTKNLIGKIGGLAIYTPLAFRKVSVPLKLPNDIELKNLKGKLRVKYVFKNKGNEAVFFEREIILD
jgi:hypothetical protein